MKKIIKNLAKKLPYLKSVLLKAEERDILMNALGFPPGHFYSPIPSIEEIKQKQDKIFGNFPQTLPGINLNIEEQLDLLKTFKPYYDEQPFTSHKVEGLRYYFENGFYSYSDAIFLYCMIRYTQPQKIIEIGSGYSSCIMLDTNQLFLNNRASCTFIEPYPDRLFSLVKSENNTQFNLIEKPLQDVDIELFQELSANDILFIDSTHVSKVNSDVNYILFDILPSLKSGVFIHFHDIFYPFEYPKDWIIKEKRAWNEDYILRAFLQYNNAFEMKIFNHFLALFYHDFFQSNMPLCLKNTGGSIWLRKN
ncbi:conserved hypothetical protein [Rippkaea orientalis PCC 8801]|uniref:Class I SAM-dependent methyltransferase n=1 Tax=Rippkaea orientalis (strain PCC 8801 / RF-1) TaxID=41431 RepID=B7JYZ4_RIPO1|nr:class I SAM-dependent methyltransferase [Rippkaea orientalis]ACK66071.1 conserved hypothetical protein [Rippkaea orientalis PCC 8801]